MKKRYFKKKTNLKQPKLKGVIFSADNHKKNLSPSFFRKHGFSIQLILIPIILGIILLIIFVVDSAIKESIIKNKITTSKGENLSPFPIVVNSYEPYVTSKAAIAIDVESQTILFSKNSQLRFSMASTVKIMTALVALEHYKQYSVLKVKSGVVEGSGINLKRGDEFYFKDLLYAMLLPSANDAAAAIADNFPGGSSSFVAEMNKKGKKLHLTDTHFADPIGLNDDGNYTTVVDLARLGSAALKNKDFSRIVSAQQKYITNVAETKEYNLTNLNKLLGTNGVNGIKTGTTEGAGEVLVTSAFLNGHTYIIVVMNSQDRFIDTESLLAFISENVKHNTSL